MISHVHVPLPVIIKVPLCGECLAASLKHALEWSLSRVCTNMGFQVAIFAADIVALKEGTLIKSFWHIKL